MIKNFGHRRAVKDARKASQNERHMFRPGIALPILGYLAAIAALAGAVVLALITHPGGNTAPMPPAGDWAALPGRLSGGGVCAIFSWAFYKLGSQRLILGEKTLQILTWGLCWAVSRDEIERVVLTPASLTIFLSDGTRIRPSMFWSSGPGMLYLQFGWFANFSSRKTIQERITAWRRTSDWDDVGEPKIAPQRRWQLRFNLPLLAGLIGMIAAEAVLVTAFA